jgi:hypothetical protein
MAKKPAKKPDSLLGWLGRQIGHVKQAVKADVTKPPPPESATPPSAPPSPPSEPTIVYRDNKVEEVDHPTQPGLKLRRTVIDEVIVDPDKPR